MRSTVAFLILALAVIANAPRANAYNSVLQTGEVVAPGAFKATIAPQAILGRYDGIAADVMLDVGVDPASSARGLIGVGNGVDFEVGGLYKYIPFPDTESQPAIGGEAGVVYARTKGLSEFDLRFNPLISKRLESEVGDFTPYISLPVGINFRDGKTLVPVQLAIGTELGLLSAPNLSFLLEAAFNLHDAFGSVTGALSWRFDEVSAKRRR